MTKLLEKYNEIISKYKANVYGEKHLTMFEILKYAGEEDLFDKMSLKEIKYLQDNSSGMTRLMFNMLFTNKYNLVKKMQKLEQELLKFNIGQYCDGKFSESTLAAKLKLEVKYLDDSKLPKDADATLSPSDNSEYLGEIKILNTNESNFPYMHEIIHYIRDVGVGNKVQCEYTRKIKGKTDSNEEQDINYLTAAAIMPISIIAEYLDKYESIVFGKEQKILIKLAKEYEQEVDAVKRRFIEVYNLVNIV